MSRGSAKGATLHYKNTTYLAVANIQDFSFPFGDCEDVEITSHNSTEKEFAPGLIDGGKITVPIVWNESETSHAWILSNLHTTKQFKYTPKDGTAVEFLAILEDLTIANPRGTGPKVRTLVLCITDGTLS